MPPSEGFKYFRLPIPFFKKILLTKSWKNHPQKLLRNIQIFSPIAAQTAQTNQTEEFIIQNVAYCPTVYKTGDLRCKGMFLDFVP